MRTRLLSLALLLTAATAWSQTQTYATITASGVENSGGTLLGSGTLCFLPVSQLTGLQMNYAVLGVGQISTAPVCTPVTSGAISPMQLTNTLITWPANACYRATVTDVTGKVIIGSSSAQ